MFKNIGKNLKDVGMAVAGGVGGEIVTHKLLHKIPKVGDKPMILSGLSAAIGVAMMDWQYDIGLGWAGFQVSKMILDVKAVRDFAYKDHGGSHGTGVNDVVNAIDAEISEALNSARTELSGEGRTLSVSLG